MKWDFDTAQTIAEAVTILGCLLCVFANWVDDNGAAVLWGITCVIWVGIAHLNRVTDRYKLVVKLSIIKKRGGELLVKTIREN